MPQAENMSELTVLQSLQEDGIDVSIDRGRGHQLTFDEWMVQNEILKNLFIKEVLYIEAKDSSMLLL